MTPGGTTEPTPGTPEPGSSAAPSLAFSFPSEPGRVGPALEKVMAACDGGALPGGSARFALRVAAGEALANAVVHGNRADPTGRVEVQVRADGDGVRVTVADEGDGLDPEGDGGPDRPPSRDRPRGRGLYLMRRLADEVRVDGDGGRVTVVVRP